MNNNVKKIATLTTALLISFTSVAGLSGNAEAESIIPTGPSSSHSGKDHRHHPGRDGNFRAGGHFILLETAKLLDMDRFELVKSLKAGKTLSQLAQEKKGWTEEQYIQKLSESAGRKLDQAISEGRLTEDEAKKMKAELPTILKQRIGKIGHFQEGKPTEQR